MRRNLIVVACFLLAMALTTAVSLADTGAGARSEFNSILPFQSVLLPMPRLCGGCGEHKVWLPVVGVRR